ncbi:ankyrin repeat [Fusarium albosuccineum]|uniref:Ankyrin repeat n=1 Tax=Fusarium albosuccineum TaxID=1237068 RepID=A0A8H4PGM3_9HYPO|nr:ankyrin repeat [Fusarium albosuccineum]
MIWFIISFFVLQVAADGGDDFSNNLFSDLAPLLALFGEQVTMQFISQSMGWADNILLAMAPIGIITTIVSAIRVGGPSWLKALIGRARENLAAAESDLMSSTSDEVCEVWNGKEVVRCMGQTPIREFIICIPNSPAKTPRVVTMNLDDAIAKGYIEDPDTEDSTRQTSQADAEQGQETLQDIAIIRNNSSTSPNIALNCHNRVKRGEVKAFAAIGTFLQTGVLLYSGFASQYPILKSKKAFQKGDKEITAYAYPCTAVGTFLVVVGMILCAHVVESSTTEKNHQISESCRGRLVWLQQEKTVSDQVFKSSALYAKNDRHIITTSVRHPDNEDKTAWGRIVEFCFHALGCIRIILRQKKTADSKNPVRFRTVLNVKTVLGMVVSVSGFVVQFVGLRGMHWSASVAQLGAVLVMTALRAVVRRGLAMPPGSETLVPGFELEWLAMTHDDVDGASWSKAANYKAARSDSGVFEVHKEKAWTVMTGETPTQYEELKEAGENGAPESAAHRVMVVRRDLGQLSGWSGVASAEAISVARSIEITMDALLKDLEGNRFTWSLNVNFGETPQLVTFRVDRQEDGVWKSYADEIEAALSLWLYSTKEQEEKEESITKDEPPLASAARKKDDSWLRAKASSSKLGLRLLGPYEKSLHRDLQWWMPATGSTIVRIEKSEENDDSEETLGSQGTSTGKPKPKIREVQSHRVVGTTTAQSLNKHDGSKAVTGNYWYKRWDMTKPSFDGWRPEEAMNGLLAAESHAPLKLLYAQDVFTAFMHSAAKTLPEPVPDGCEIRPSLMTGEDAWKSFTLDNHRLSKIAQEIQRTGLGTLGEVFLSIVVSLSLEAKLPSINQVLERARKHAEPDERLNHWDQTVHIYMWLFNLGRTFPPLSKTSIKSTAFPMEILRMLVLNIQLLEAEEQKMAPLSSDPSKLIEWKWTLEDMILTEGGDVGLNLMSLYKTEGRGWEFGSYRAQFYGLPPDELSTDYATLFTYTELHRSAAYSDWLSRKYVDTGNQSIKVNEITIHDWTSVHYAAKFANDKTIWPSEFKSDVVSQDISGWAPLHYACENGSTSITRVLLHLDADIDVCSRDGTTPLHCAAKGGHFDAFELLLQTGANADVRDAWGRTPLHWAAYNGHTAIVKLLAQQSNSNQRDQSGRTVLHLAAIGGRLQSVELLVTLGAKREAKDRNGRTPLHFASAYGHTDVVNFFASALNKDEAGDNGWAALHLASWNGHTGIVKHLAIRVQADIEKTEEFKQTPLHLAAKAGHLDVVEFLVQMGANMPAGLAGETPLQQAAEGGHSDIVQFLVEQGPSMSNQDSGGSSSEMCYSPYWAFQKYCAEVVRVLVEKGVDAQARGKCGWSPLHLAAARGMVNGAKVLLEKKADLELKNN